jgi:citrate synthase
MENTEKRYKRGLYNVVGPKEVLAATKDDWELVEIIESPGRPLCFLLKGEADKATALQKSRGETDRVKEELRDQIRTSTAEHRGLSEKVDELNRHREQAESLASSCAESESKAQEREQELRAKMVAQEEALNLYRQEVGRARQAEIETEAVQVGELLLGPLKGRRSGDVVEMLIEKLEELQVTSVVAYHQGRHLSIPELLRFLQPSVKGEMGW